jgi:cytochrome c biogenesis protein CcmG, thiol:disulfide interchange protein DsbE
MWKFLLPAAAFAALVLIFALGLQRDPAYVPSPLIGKPAPEFRLRDLHQPGEVLSATTLQGRFGLVNVWGTWCAGCRQEHEVLLTLAEDSGVPILGINWKDDARLARQWLVELGNPYVAVAEDVDGRVAIDWGVYGAPETFLLDPQGIVRFKHIGPMTLDVWTQNFLPIIQAGSESRTSS